MLWWVYKSWVPKLSDYIFWGCIYTFFLFSNLKSRGEFAEVTDFKYGNYFFNSYSLTSVALEIMSVELISFFYGINTLSVVWQYSEAVIWDELESRFLDFSIF